METWLFWRPASSDCTLGRERKTGKSANPACLIQARAHLSFWQPISSRGGSERGSPDPQPSWHRVLLWLRTPALRLSKTKLRPPGEKTGLVCRGTTDTLLNDRLMRTTTILASLIVPLTAVVVLSVAAEKQRFKVTITPNAELVATFHRKEKTKNRGWKVFIRFTNKTDNPIRSIGTDYQLREGGWTISDSWTQTASSSPLLLPRQSAVFGWIDGVPSSVDSIHIERVEIE